MLALVENWRAVLLHAWSARLLYAAIALEIAGELVPFLSLPPLVTALILVASVTARIVKQRSVSGDADVSLEAK